MIRPATGAGGTGAGVSRPCRSCGTVFARPLTSRTTYCGDTCRTAAAQRQIEEFRERRADERARLRATPDDHDVMPVAAIANRLHLPPATVDDTLRRALAKARRLLAARGIHHLHQLL
jgi:hypothetical protein